MTSEEGLRLSLLSACFFQLKLIKSSFMLSDCLYPVLGNALAARLKLCCLLVFVELPHDFVIIVGTSFYLL